VRHSAIWRHSLYAVPLSDEGRACVCSPAAHPTRRTQQRHCSPLLPTSPLRRARSRSCTTPWIAQRWSGTSCSASWRVCAASRRWPAVQWLGAARARAGPAARCPQIRPRCRLSPRSWRRRPCRCGRMHIAVLRILTSFAVCAASASVARPRDASVCVASGRVCARLRLVDVAGGAAAAHADRGSPVGRCGARPRHRLRHLAKVRLSVLSVTWNANLNMKSFFLHGHQSYFSFPHCCFKQKFRVEI
jgi:hypothetical protein